MPGKTSGPRDRQPVWGALFAGITLSLVLESVACSAGRPEGLGPPTPAGPVGEPRDMRADLPTNADPIATLDPSHAAAHVLELGQRGHNTTLRVLSWTTCLRDELQLCRDLRIGAVGVEVLENPEATTVTWTSGDRTAGAVPLDMIVAWPTSNGGIGELRLEGRVVEASATWEPTER